MATPLGRRGIAMPEEIGTISQDSLSEIVTRMFQPFALVYCVYIADAIRRTLANPCDQIVETVGHVESDLHSTGGYMLTTKKTLRVQGRNGRHYRITVEEVSK
jgi:hypothetical protein